MDLEKLQVGGPKQDTRDAIRALLTEHTRFARDASSIEFLAEQAASGRRVYAVRFACRDPRLMAEEMYWLAEAVQSEDGAWYAGRSGDALKPDASVGPLPRVNLCVGGLKGNRYTAFSGAGFVVDPAQRVARVSLTDQAGVVLEATVTHGAVAFVHPDQLEAPFVVRLQDGSSTLVAEQAFE